MNSKSKKIVLATGIVLGVCLVGAGAFYYRLAKASCYKGEKTYVYIDRDDNVDSVLQKLQDKGVHTQGWKVLEKRTPFHVHTGKYAIGPLDALQTVYRRLSLHLQEPVRLTIPSVRLSIAPEGQPQPQPLDRLVGAVTKNLMMDEAELAQLTSDTCRYKDYGLTRETFPTLFLPNTYEVYWDITPQELMARIKKEYDNFWTAQRREKAQEKGLTPVTATILASIVEEETGNETEKYKVAGLYLNRLKRGMALQADPTVKFAVGDWSLRRVLNVHLKKESPYNTYRVTGLPPGPLRVPTLKGIDAVLNAQKHDYIYMCAKEDFSGTHNFAATYEQHRQNARRYIEALNRRGIK